MRNIIQALDDTKGSGRPIWENLLVDMRENPTRYSVVGPCDVTHITKASWARGQSYTLEETPRSTDITHIKRGNLFIHKLMGPPCDDCRSKEPINRLCQPTSLLNGMLLYHDMVSLACEADGHIRDNRTNYTPAITFRLTATLQQDTPEEGVSMYQVSSREFLIVKNKPF